MINKLDNTYTSYNRIKFYYGLVESVDDNYNITFRIPIQLDNLADGEYPIAHPILKHTSEVRVGDNVLIMQLDEDIQDFVYFSNDTTTFTGIEYGNNRIDLSDKETIKIQHVKQRDDSFNPTEVTSSITISDGEINAEILNGGSVTTNLKIKNGEILAENKNQGSIKINKNKISINNSSKKLAKLLESLIDEISSMKTMGPPGNHLVSPDSMAKFMKIKMELKMLLSE